MRSRNIKPGFFINESLSEVDCATRLLFIGIWCFADREGRFEWKPKKIHAAIFPYDHDFDIEKMLCNLMSLHLITCQDKVGYIPRFREHQHPHPHEAKSKLPAYNEQIQEDTKCNEMSLQVMKCQADIRILGYSDSINPPIPPCGEILEKPKRKKRISELPKDQLESFKKFWAVWPKHIAQADAEKAWLKISPTNGQVEVICHAVERWKKSQKWQENNGEFIPYPATWLNGKRWRDEIKSTVIENYHQNVIKCGDESIFADPEK